MAGSKEIRNKIKSVQSTRKITKAMEMVAASKMKKAQDRMRASRPYVFRALQIAMHVAKANTEYKHPFLVRRDPVRRVGAIVITTDKGLCGGLNTNVLRLVLNQHKAWMESGVEVEYCAIGSKGFGFTTEALCSQQALAVYVADCKAGTVLFPKPPIRSVFARAPLKNPWGRSKHPVPPYITEHWRSSPHPGSRSADVLYSGAFNCRITAFSLSGTSMLDDIKQQFLNS